MMTSIFTSFDTSLHQFFPSMWAYTYTILFLSALITSCTWTMNSHTMPITSISNLMINITTTSKLKMSPGGSFTLSCLFTLLLTLNLMGLLPYIIPLTSHLFLTLSGGSTMWLAMVMISMSNYKTAKSHYLPENTPLLMSSFMSMVESVSSVIRPLTLSFRLAANISAGHIILAMIMMMLTTSLLSSSPLSVLLLTIGSSYTSFEVFVSFIQAFVFTLLGFMYANDYLPIKPLFFMFAV